MVLAISTTTMLLSRSTTTRSTNDYNRLEIGVKIVPSGAFHGVDASPKIIVL